MRLTTKPPPLRTRLANGERLDVEGLPVRLRVDARARRVSLRIDAARRELIATAPSPRRLIEAIDFVRAKRSWVDERLARLPRPEPITTSQPLMVFGQAYHLRADGRRPCLTPPAQGENGVISGCGEHGVDPQLVIRLVKTLATARFGELVGGHCARLGVPAPALAISNARGRWGSCAPPGGRGARIRLSWRLALAPPAIADYVAAHECAHLIEANHGPRFWALVGSLVGDPAPSRAWLRAHGGELHGFGAAP
ncbi:MAG: SprT family zinc-dependent metalloprotease [Caulobacteraceae bacterium]